MLACIRNFRPWALSAVFLVTGAVAWADDAPAPAKSAPAAAASSTAAADSEKDSSKAPEKDSKKDSKKDGAKKAAPAKESGKTAVKEKTAVISTTAGDISVRLFPDRAPKAVDNFIGLATGKKEWKDPSGKAVKGKSLYKGTIFHRIIPDFMIQGGDPQGNGMGGPGYTFDDEVKPSDNFDHAGILAMANSGPNTNGSQFFITVKAASWLNGKYTIFGEVTKGMEIVQKIVSAPKGADDRPENPVTIKDVKIK